jgi:glycosyltransferase involved in cell wall biosynthesis
MQSELFSMKILWYWPHPHESLSPSAASMLHAGDAVTVQCLTTFRDKDDDDPRAEFRRELPETRSLTAVPSFLRRALRVETYLRRAVMRERLARSSDFDVCLVETINILTDAWAFARLRRRLPVVAVVHDVVPHEMRLPARIERRLLTRTYRAADVMVVLHQVISDRLIEDFGVEPSRVVVGRHPVPVTPREPTAFDERRWMPGSATRFLFFGSFRHDKGLPVLLDAAKRLSSDQAVQIHVAGSGEAALERLVSEATERSLVTSDIGWISAARKDELFRSTDVVVLPYSDPDRFQSQSGVLADSYAYGRPVIATDVGAVGPTIRVDSSGWVVRPGDAAALAGQISRVALDVHGREAATRSIAAVRDQYSFDQLGKTLRTACETAIGLWDTNPRARELNW